MSGSYLHQAILQIETYVSYMLFCCTNCMHLWMLKIQGRWIWNMEVGSLESAFQLWSGRHRASPALLKRRFNKLSALIVQTIYTKRRRELVHTYDMNID